MDYVFWLEGVPHFAMWGWWYIYEGFWALLTYWTWYYPQLKPGNSDFRWFLKNNEFQGYWNLSIALWKFYVPFMYINGYNAMWWTSFFRNVVVWLGLGEGPFVEMYDYWWRHVSVTYLDFRSYADGEWSTLLLGAPFMATGFWVLSIISYLLLGWETQLWCLVFPCQPFSLV